MTNIQRLRDAAFVHQAGRCHYCRAPMWRIDCTSFAKANGMSVARARWFQSTAEHVLPRSKGGPDTAANIVAACRYCNVHRHRARRALAAEDFRSEVLKRLAAGRWHRLRPT